MPSIFPWRQTPPAPEPAHVAEARRVANNKKVVTPEETAGKGFHLAAYEKDRPPKPATRRANPKRPEAADNPIQGMTLAELQASQFREFQQGQAQQGLEHLNELIIQATDANGAPIVLPVQARGTVDPGVLAGHANQLIAASIVPLVVRDPDAARLAATRAPALDYARSFEGVIANAANGNPAPAPVAQELTRPMIAALRKLDVEIAANTAPESISLITGLLQQVTGIYTRSDLPDATKKLDYFKDDASIHQSQAEHILDKMNAMAPAFKSIPIGQVDEDPRLPWLLHYLGQKNDGINLELQILRPTLDGKRFEVARQAVGDAANLGRKKIALVMVGPRFQAVRSVTPMTNPELTPDKRWGQKSTYGKFKAVCENVLHPSRLLAARMSPTQLKERVELVYKKVEKKGDIEDNVYVKALKKRTDPQSILKGKLTLTQTISKNLGMSADPTAQPLSAEETREIQALLEKDYSIFDAWKRFKGDRKLKRARLAAEPTIEMAQANNIAMAQKIATARREKARLTEEVERVKQAAPSNWIPAVPAIKEIPSVRIKPLKAELDSFFATAAAIDPHSQALTNAVREAHRARVLLDDAVLQSDTAKLTAAEGKMRTALDELRLDANFAAARQIVLAHPMDPTNASASENANIADFIHSEKDRRIVLELGKHLNTERKSVEEKLAVLRAPANANAGNIAPAVPLEPIAPKELELRAKEEELRLLAIGITTAKMERRLIRSRSVPPGGNAAAQANAQAGAGAANPPNQNLGDFDQQETIIRLLKEQSAALERDIARRKEEIKVLTVLHAVANNPNAQAEWEARQDALNDTNAVLTAVKEHAQAARAIVPNDLETQAFNGNLATLRAYWTAEGLDPPDQVAQDALAAAQAALAAAPAQQQGPAAPPPGPAAPPPNPAAPPPGPAAP